MSIKGIDAQLMVTRAADLAKDSSTQLKKNELMQDYLAVHAKAVEHQEQTKVAKAIESQQVSINKDKDKDSSPGSQDQNPKKTPEDEALEELDTYISDSSTIDIKI